MAIKSDFFIAGDSYYQKTPPVTDEQLQQFSERRGLRLPDAFVALLRIQNGGSLRKALFVTDTEGEYYLYNLPGIGDTRGSFLDLLNDEIFTDVEDREILKGLLFIDVDIEDKMALDYRQCGPMGDPSVVTVWFDDPSTIDSVTIVNSFEEFINGLQRAEGDYYIGFYGASDDGEDLRSELAKCLHADVRFNGNQDQPEFSIRPLGWTYNQKVWLAPNVDYAEDYDEEDNCLSRPAGFFFPEYPECTWMLSSGSDVERIEELLELLKSQPYESVVMHQPRVKPIMSEIHFEGEEPELETFDESEEPIIIDGPGGLQIELSMGAAIISKFGNFQIELSPDFGYDGVALATGESFSKSSCRILGKDSLFTLSHMRLSVGDNFFGEVEDGDEIYVVNEDAVFVNGQKREVREG